jgi:long-chain fatty acid transport protein
MNASVGTIVSTSRVETQVNRRTVPITRASLSALAVMAVVCAPVAPASAGGFYVQEQSKRGAGRAFSGEAAETGADALWWNPASIARSGREAVVGVTARDFRTFVEDDGSTITRPIPPAGLTTPVGGRSRIEGGSRDDFLPMGAFATPVGDRFAAGVSVNRPFMLETEYGEDAWTRYDTVRNRIETTNIQATAAMQVTERLDIGIGVDAQYTDAALILASPNLSPLLPDGETLLEGDGWNYGYVVGAQLHLERFSLGASYRSAMKHELRGRIRLSGLTAPLDGANFQSMAETVFSTPDIAVIGVRWRVSPDLTLNAQIQHFGWSEYDAIRIDMDAGKDTIAQNFKDVTTLALGADYAVNRRLTLRAGVQDDPTPTPDDLREPGVADSDRRLYTAGASLRVRPKLTVDAALGYTDFSGARIHEDSVNYPGTPAATLTRMRGKFGGETRSASVGVRLSF